MMSRCYNSNDKDYKSIGAKGISVYPRWREFSAFVEDMGTKPEGAYLRRLDESADFEPGNCVWQPAVNAKTNPLYGIWKGIRRRCGVIGVKESIAAAHYKGRGVTMHPDWADDFLTFARDVGERPSPQHTLDRIDNDAGYFPGNVRWALPVEQQNNRVDNIYLEIKGTRRTLSQWAAHYDLDVATLGARFSKLFDPAEPRKQRVQQSTVSGEVVAVFNSVAEASTATGVGRAALQKCLCGSNRTSGGFKWCYIPD